MDATLQQLFDVRGKTAFVTGGTRGIGMMLAGGLLDAGVRVLISSRKADAVAAAVDDLQPRGDVHGIVGDVSTPDGARTLAAAAHELAGGTLDLLVNNAGVTWGAPLEDFPDVGWDRVMHTNVEGVFHLTVALLPALRAAATPGDPARVVNVGSIDGLRAPTMDNFSYAASKAAVHTLTRHLAGKLAAEHITVNAIAPGPFESRMTKFVVEDPALLQAATAEVPLARFGTAEDVTGLVVFLASRAGAYLTGTVIPLDGGITGCR